MQLTSITTCALVAAVVNGRAINSTNVPYAKCLVADSKNSQHFGIFAFNWHHADDFSIEDTLGKELEKCKAPERGLKYNFVPAPSWRKKKNDAAFVANGQIKKGEKKCVEEAIKETLQARKGDWKQPKNAIECHLTDHIKFNFGWNAGSRNKTSISGGFASGTGVINFEPTSIKDGIPSIQTASNYAPVPTQVLSGLSKGFGAATSILSDVANALPTETGRAKDNNDAAPKTKTKTDAATKAPASHIVGDATSLAAAFMAIQTNVAI